MRDVVLRGGPPVHPWVYSKRVLDVQGGVKDGEVVRLKTREGRPCGHGFFHSRSLVAVRVLTLDPERVPDEAWLFARVREAARLRTEGLRVDEVTDAWRVVHGEADGLSGLVVDRYGDVASVSLYALGWWKRREEVERALRAEAGVKRVVMRADERTEQMEGFRADPPRDAGTVEIRERGVRYLVDLAGGHKTGFFLDQRDHRDLVARLARGRHVLDCMTYTGGFAVAAAVRGEPASVRALDLDEEALEVAAGNAKRNKVEVRFEHRDVFDALREVVAGPAAEKPGLVVVDPPKWAKDRAGLRAAMSKYADLNRLALAAVGPGGFVLTCSCSGLVSAEEFQGMLRGVALDLRADLRFLHMGGAALDHPWSSSFPEGRYLKAVLVAPGVPGSGPGRSEAPGRPGLRRGPSRDPSRDDGGPDGAGPDAYDDRS